MTIETLTVARPMPLDQLLFETSRREVPGLVEATLVLNPGLAARGPLLPRGQTVRVEVPAPRSRTTPTRKLIRLTD